MTNRTGVGKPRLTHADAGSVTPLIIGMMLCLLILGAGVTAAGSAFLGGQTVQHLCDGAAAAAADTLTDKTDTDRSFTNAINDYLAVRHSNIAATSNLNGTTITLTCTADTPITFGHLFATATLHRTTTSTAQIRYHQN